MKIVSTVRTSPLKKQEIRVVVPDGQSREPSREEAVGIAEAAGKVVAKNLGAGAAATAAWQLTKVPLATSDEQLAGWLIENNLTPEKAPQVAAELRGLLSNPAVRCVLFGVSASVAAYAVVEKTSWRPRTKIIAILSVAIFAGGAYLVLRHFGYVY